MLIERFFDEGLAHASYALVSQGQMAVVDPARDPQPYLDFAKAHDARIVAIFETHPHADFVSSHLELAQLTGATIYVSRLLGAAYASQGFDDGDSLQLGALTLKALNTPGHSPDSISILVQDAEGKEQAVFTGDTLFVGDVGRPDLRESVGSITAKREELARAMYKSTRNVLMQLPDEVLVYPAHGAGSLCGKALSNDPFTTIGREKSSNYALQPMDEDQFVRVLLKDQPFVPKYFGYDVTLNKNGAQPINSSLARIRRTAELMPQDLANVLVVDARPIETFKKGHIRGAINIPQGKKFETWLGAIIAPGEEFVLIGSNPADVESLINKAAKIGYEPFIRAASWATAAEASSAFIKPEEFDAKRGGFTIIDLRNYSERAEKVTFAGSMHIPVNELRDRLGELPEGQPLVVHCAAGVRSAMGQSIIERDRPELQVFDLGESIKQYV